MFDIASCFAAVASCFLESAVLVLLSVLTRLFDFILFKQNSCFILFYLDAIRATQKQQPLSQFKAVASKDVIVVSCLSTVRVLFITVCVFFLFACVSICLIARLDCHARVLFILPLRLTFVCFSFDYVLRCITLNP